MPSFRGFIYSCAPHPSADLPYTPAADAGFRDHAGSGNAGSWPGGTAMRCNIWSLRPESGDRPASSPADQQRVGAGRPIHRLAVRTTIGTCCSVHRRRLKASDERADFTCLLPTERCSAARPRPYNQRPLVAKSNSGCARPDRATSQPSGRGIPGSPSPRSVAGVLTG